MDKLIDTHSTAHKSVFVRVSMIVAGVMIAIICSVLALKNIESTSDSANTFKDSTPAINTTVLAKTASVLGHAVIVFSNK